MPRKVSVSKSEAALLGAAREGRWDVAARAQDRLQQLLVGAIASRAREDVEMIGSVFDKAQKTIVYVHDIPSMLDAAAHAWMLKASAAIAGLATREMPVGAPTLTLAQGTVRERILCTLYETPAQRLTNYELAAATRATPETIARVLPALRLEGVIATKPIGAARLNWLTKSGEAAAAKYKAMHAPARSITVDIALQKSSTAFGAWSRNFETQRPRWDNEPGTRH